MERFKSNAVLLYLGKASVHRAYNWARLGPQAKTVERASAAVRIRLLTPVSQYPGMAYRDAR